MDLVGQLQANCLSLVEPQLNPSLLRYVKTTDYKTRMFYGSDRVATVYMTKVILTF